LHWLFTQSYVYFMSIVCGHPQGGEIQAHMDSCEHEVKNLDFHVDTVYE